MTYLLRALVGNAKRAIGGILNHDHLYKAALTELEEQFGNEELVAGVFIKTVLDHPIVADGDVTQPRSFYNTLHNAVATMRSLGYSHDLASSSNTHAALQKLPDPLKEKWGERNIEIHPTILTLVDIDEWFRARLRAKTLSVNPYQASVSRQRAEDLDIEDRREMEIKASKTVKSSFADDRP